MGMDHLRVLVHLSLVGTMIVSVLVITGAIQSDVLFGGAIFITATILSFELGVQYHALRSDS